MTNLGRSVLKVEQEYFSNPAPFQLKGTGIVQRKLRWVESGVNRWVMLQYWSAGHYFLILKGYYLVFRIKLFAAT